MKEELILSLADNMIWCVVFCIVSGALAGWYATFSHYRQKEREREAVESYKLEERTSRPPKSDFEKVQDCLRTLEKIITKYHVEWSETHWDYVEAAEE